jgi:NAD+ synthase (glutamine-hydrolysing)
VVESAEFKRRQAAPGIKVTDRAFGTGWRMPIASKQEEQEGFVLEELQKEKL